MPSKRDPGKQGRQARNQARRQAGAVRRDYAAASSQSAAGDAGTGSGTTGSTASTDTASSTGPVQAASGWMRGRAPRTGVTGGNRPVGWRAALASVLMATVAFGLLVFNQVTVDADDKAIPATELSSDYRVAKFAVVSGLDEPVGEEGPSAAVDEAKAGHDEKANAFVAYWPVSLLFPVPIIIAGLALWMIHTGRATGRNLMFCLFGMFFASILTGVFFLPALVALGVANFQVRRAEAAGLALARADAGDGPAAGGDVIEVDEAELDEAELDEAAPSDGSSNVDNGSADRRR